MEIGLIILAAYSIGAGLGFLAGIEYTNNKAKKEKDMDDVP